MTLPFAQFVWIVEFATEDDWAIGQISARAVLDATASLREVMPFWLFHNRTAGPYFRPQQGGAGIARYQRAWSFRHGKHGPYTLGSEPTADPEQMKPRFSSAQGAELAFSIDGSRQMDEKKERRRVRADRRSEAGRSKRA